MDIYDTGGDEYDTFLPDESGRGGETIKPWDSFKILHKKPDVGSTVESKWIENGVKVLKVSTIIIIFTVVLISAVLSKTTLLFMTSQVKNNVTKQYCNKFIDVDREYVYTNSDSERATWIWLIIFAYAVPELGTFLRSIRILIFKTWVYPKPRDFLGRLGVESLSAIGSALFVFGVLPELDVIKGAMLANAICLIPSIGSVFNTKKFQSSNNYTIIIDILAILAQLSACVVWPLTQNRPILYLIPASVLLISLGWWENFFPEKIVTYFLNQKDQPKTDLAKNMYFTYSIVSIMKCMLFLSTTLLYFYLVDGKCIFLFTEFLEAFSEHPITITEVQFQLGDNAEYLNSAISTGVIYQNYNDTLFNIVIFLINITATYICYAFGKFACKIMIQIAGFALPINLTVPILLTLLISLCGPYIEDKCVYFDAYSPAYLFFNVPPSKDMIGFLVDEYAWIWLLWLVSQIWITQHIWTNRNFVLSSTEELFIKPMYDAFFIDQSVALNRRNIKEAPKGGQDIELDKYDDSITRIYACATMWHETRSEMMDFLISVLRMDEDQAARRIVKQYLQYPVESYYEWETHIFFDDAFVRKSSNDNDPNLNPYVMDLLDTVPEAASEVHKTKVRIKPPEIFPTPYGGRLVWTLPGKTKMIAHLKDKAKIRAKKRWSQVMYMYYLLGHRLMENDDFSPEEVKERSRNTYIMALDGDIDFQPDAVHLLVQCMKRNPSLGAACGRIHPVGSGLIAWYQIFEYAVGHWMQKATEHVIGCVLCSPGCFSLFRASALMDHNVMARYTTRSEEARHYVQYDQGEDRWLCTLLLQRGYRVEYAAASDAYTHCPEGFNEFYNQRRRWMPSTMANILDLLQDAKHIIKENDDISRLYIFYQIVLMVGTIIGPGTIFLMLVGASVAVFEYAQWTAFLYNLVPIVLFVAVCMFCKSDFQLLVAAIISACYGLLMMAVVIGVVMQIMEDGFMAPSPLFFFLMAGDYIIAALIHPKEFYCLKYGIIYLVTVPSMYMLLVIYSVFNMNNVSWGTREVTVVANNPGSAPKVQVKKKKQSPLWLFVLKIRDFIKQFVKPPLHHVMISNMLKHVEQRFDFIKKRIKRIEDIKIDPSSEEVMQSRKSLKRGSVLMLPPIEDIQEAGEEIEENDSWDTAINGFNSNSWFYNGPLIWSQVTYLDPKEQTFWQDLLDKYLYPIEDDKAKVAKALKDLRDKIVMMFFFINSMFVLVVFLLTLQKDLVHLEWPFDAQYNFSYTNSEGANEISVGTTYLQLEPIGFVFMIFFFGLLLIQFLCMFLHRFATYSQIMANTSLDFNFCSTEVENMTKEELLDKDPITIFRKLIRLRGVNGDEENEKEINEEVSRRSTVVNLVKNKEKVRATINDLDTAFAVRMAKIREEGNCDVPVSTDNITAINRRRTTVLRRQSQMPSNMQKVTFDVEPAATVHFFDNNAYEDSL